MLHLQALARQTAGFRALKLRKQMFPALLPINMLCITGETMAILFAKGLKFFMH